MSAPALVIKELRKRYTRRGPWVLDGLSCVFPRGSVSGLVGPNGAGKTTLFSAVVGFLRLQGGSVDILGEGPFDPFRLKGRVGVLPQDAQLDPRLTPAVFLKGMARLQGMSRDQANVAADQVLGSVNLTEHAGKRVETLSHGMRRRITVASALLGEPDLVLLDEPLSGLDPRESASLRSLLGSLGGRSSLVISSHNLAELERVCDHVVLIEQGRCIGEGTVESLTARGAVETWTIGPGVFAIDGLLGALPGHSLKLEERTLTHKAPTESDLDAGSVVIAGQLAAAGIAIRGVRRGRSLEDSYLERTQQLNGKEGGQ